MKFFRSCFSYTYGMWSVTGRVQEEWKQHNINPLTDYERKCEIELQPLSVLSNCKKSWTIHLGNACWYFTESVENRSWKFSKTRCKFSKRLSVSQKWLARCRKLFPSLKAQKLLSYGSGKRVVGGIAESVSGNQPYPAKWLCEQPIRELPIC